jgi:predicted nucleic acid-binding Zn ribbon protein
VAHRQLPPTDHQRTRQRRDRRKFGGSPAADRRKATPGAYLLDRLPQQKLLERGVAGFWTPRLAAPRTGVMDLAPMTLRLPSCA